MPDSGPARHAINIFAITELAFDGVCRIAATIVASAKSRDYLVENIPRRPCIGPISSPSDPLRIPISYSVSQLDLDTAQTDDQMSHGSMFHKNEFDL